MAANSLFSDIVKLTLFKMTEAINYYQNQANRCQNITSKHFLLYIAGKKKNQRKYLGRIIKNSGFDNFLSPPEYESRRKYLNLYSIPLYKDSTREIFEIVLVNAQKELEFYQFLKVVQKNAMHNSLLNALIDLSGDFLFEVKAGYLNCTLKFDKYNHAGNADKAKNISLNRKYASGKI